MLVGLGLSWGLTWPAMRLALNDIPPMTMRATAALLGTLIMFVLAGLARRPVRMLRPREWGDVLVLAFLNVVVFSVCVAYAQMTARTGRVAILVYTMPLWSALLSWAVLGERLDGLRLMALGTCLAGVCVLIAPLMDGGVPFGLVLALIASVSWSLGTVYMKWRRVQIEPFTFTAWQLIVTTAAIGTLAFVAERQMWSFGAVGPAAITGMLFTGLFGSGIAYYLWFHIVRILPTTTASLGALASPVIGTLASIPVLGEVPTLYDTAGFALIFLSAAAVMLRPAMAPAR